MLLMRHPNTIVTLLFFCSNYPSGAFADDEQQSGPNPQALAAFDNSVNGSTQLVDNIPKADREAIMEEHRENEAWAFDDDMCAIDDAMWYGYARKKGWLNNN